MNRGMSHSEGGHRRRRYRRKVRNMLFEITLIIIFVFAAINFVKEDDEKPKVSKISAEEQKHIIDNEMGLNKEEKDRNSKELTFPDTIENIRILKIVLNYQEQNNETIISLDIESADKQIAEQKYLMKILDKKQKELTTTNVNIPYLDKNRQTRVNVVLEGDYRNAESVQIHEENK